VRLVGEYFRLSGRFEPARFEDRSPVAADPLWIVHAERVAG